MAQRFARKNGNWNASDVWSDTPSGTAGAQFIPTTGDVAMANSFTVTVNVDATCAEVRNDTTGGATAGGLFDLASGVTLTANAFAGAAAGQCVRYALTATAYFVGNVQAGSGNAALGIANSSTGTLVITGHLTGGSAGNCHGAQNASSGTIVITGDTTGGSTGTAYGTNNASNGTIVINGAAYGAVGYGAHNAITGTLTLNGAAYGSTSAAPGLYGANGGGFTYAKGAGYVSVTGCMPYGGHIRFDFTASSLLYVRDQNLVQRTYIPAEYSVSNGVPASTDVRYGTSYALGALTGTAHIPAASSVVKGVPVDATVGTADLLTAADVRSALGLATANLDTQLADLPTATENATAVWGNVTRTLTEGGGISAQDVWEYATREITGGTVDTLTNAPDVPSAETIAAEVRTELTPELSRVANCATVESTGDQLAGLL